MARVVRRVLLVASSLLILSSCFGFGLLIGQMRVRHEIYNRQYLSERESIEPILNQDPAFADLEIHVSSEGHMYLIGPIPSKVDFDRLRSRIVQVVGEKRADEILRGVAARVPAQ